MSYSLKELEGRLLRFHKGENTFEEVQTVGEADGVSFLCPKCYAANGGAAGTHSVPLWFSSLGEARSRQLQGHPGWNKSGKSLDDLTFVKPGAVSVLLKSGCCWHGFVRDGRATLS